MNLPIRICSFAALATLTACSSSKPFKDTANALPFVMNQSEHIALQRPNLPNTAYVAWTPTDRLYHSVVVDFVEGMSQRSYLFSKPNQDSYSKMLLPALRDSGLLARSPSEARYALQVSFEDINANAIGGDFVGQSKANYKLVNRRTGEVIFSTNVESRFVAVYPRLNERDFSKAYDIARPGVGAAVSGYGAYALAEGGIVELYNNDLVELVNNNNDLVDFFGGPIDFVDEATQATWTDVQQAFVWTTGLSTLGGALAILIEQLDPTNYIALASDNEFQDDLVNQWGRGGARKGYLSEQGIGDRDGRDRARQASTMMLGQSVTKFLLDLGKAEGIRFKAILPCTNNVEVEAAKTELMLQGYGFRTDACLPIRDDPKYRAPGWKYTTWQ